MTLGFISHVGARAIARWRFACQLAATVAASFALALRPSFWPRSVRVQLARQIVFTAVDALPLTLFMAALGGVAIVAQASLWLLRFGQSAVLGPLLVSVVVRELAPLFVCFIVIGRSGTAIAAELASMRVRGEVHVLDAQGLDPFAYLVMPRVIGASISVFCLTVVFTFLCFASGYFCGFLAGVASRDPGVFIGNLVGAIYSRDVFTVLGKTVVPGAMIGATACIEGLTVGTAVTEVPQAVTRSVVKSLVGVLLVLVLISVLAYV